MAKPLTNRRRDGGLYTRPPEIDAEIEALLILPRVSIVTRLACRSAADPDHISSEALLHLLRETRADNGLDYFNTLYRELLRRIGRALPQSDTYSVEGKAATDERLERVRDAVLKRFEGAVVEDRYRAGMELDIFECRFNYTIEKMREKAWAKHYREAARRHTKTVEMLEISIDSGEQEFASLRDRFFSDSTSRILLYAEIDSLPHPDRRILQMLIEGFPVESSKPGLKTITGEVGCDCKTVWNRRGAFVERMCSKLDGVQGR
jgi:hypothetical protein